MAKSFLMDLYKKASLNVASKNLLKTDLLVAIFDKYRI